MQKEINKWLKELSAAKLRGDHKDCVELNNFIGGTYSEIGSYDEAIHHHEQALDLSKTLGDRLNTAICHRHIGEAKASLGDYEEAIKHIRLYVELAQKVNDRVEIQRSWTTLGRIYLMQAQSLHDGEQSSAKDRTKRDIAREAEKHFQTALNMAESVRDDIDNKEYSSMITSLLINMGIIKDLRGLKREAVVKFNRAAEMCRNMKLREDLHRCCLISSPIYRRWNETKMAAKSSEEAVKVAKSIGKKVLICEALLELGYTRIWQRDFKNAKRTFAQAYLEKSPSEEDHIKAIRLTKLAHLVATTYDKLSQETAASESRKSLCDKMGDLTLAFENYRLAAEYYRQAYLSAKACLLPKNEQARLLFSVAECYADAGQYEHALACFQKEASLRDGIPKEQSPTYIKIAHMMEYLDKHSDQVCDNYEKALQKAEKDPKLMYNALRWYVPYLEQKGCNIDRLRELQEMLNNVRSFPEVVDDIEAEEYEEANELEDEIANVDDVITDDEDNDEVLMVGRRRTKGPNKFKTNEVGDTPLHEAAIKGDLKRAKSLVGQGHKINVKDNAGWTPLHEACNNGHYDVAEYLISQGADINNRGHRGLTPLHDAAENGQFEIMRLLIKHGANILQLTDDDANVLVSLRNFKREYYQKLSNSQQSEYKQMEAELLNLLDKCGSSLMTENFRKSTSSEVLRPSGQSANRATTSGRSAANHRRPLPNSSAYMSKERSSSVYSQCSTASSSTLTSRLTSDNSGVREYRDAMGTLKRKRPLDISQAKPTKKASLPAVVKTNDNPSMSTKNWLMKDDEVIEEGDDDEDEDVLIAAQRRGALKSERRNIAAKNVIDDDDDDDVLFVREDNWPELEQHETERTTSMSTSHPIVELTDDESLGIRSPSPTMANLRPSAESNQRNASTPISCGNQSPFNMTHNSNFSTGSTFDLFSRPLVVAISDRKLLIPIKSEKMTISELKEAIVSRYSIIVNAKPLISLAPKSDSLCLLFDDDLCKDVIREELVARVVSWQLPSILDSYVQRCADHSLSPLTFVKTELRNLDSQGSNLELSFVRFPVAHRDAVAQALARRDFVNANLKGSTSLFEKRQDGLSSAQTNITMMDSIITWTKLTRLNLKCTGLLRAHFEQLCQVPGGTLPELQDLELSNNSILYQEKDDLVKQVETLHSSCPKMKRLDMSGNLLKFVESFPELMAGTTINQYIEVVL